MNYYTAAAPTGQTSSGAIHAVTTSDLSIAVSGSSVLQLSESSWYDIAIVIDDKGDSDQTTTRLTFYMVGPDGILKSYQRISENIWGSSSAGTNLIVGTESTGPGTGNGRKTFNGALDYLAIYDQALTMEEVTAIFAVPEPSRSILMIAAMAALCLPRRRHFL